MPTTRDQLIADWRQQLAAAEESVAGPGRLAWLSRMRVRLYRFLLACYGKGDWIPPTPAERTSQTLDPAEPLPLDGKPAKSAGQIRSVLAAVAGAQGDPHAPGPLAAGLEPESWVVAAAASSKLKTGRCYELLRAAGLHPRKRYCGDDQMVEVPACERHEALALIEQNRQRVHQPPNTPRTQRIPLWARWAAAAIVSTWVTGLLAATVFAAIWGVSTASQAELPLDLFNLPEFYFLWCSLFVLLLLLFGLRTIRQNRPVSAGKRPANR
jgi:hypothetical protein